MGEGKAASKSARAARKRGGTPLKDAAAQARAGILLSAAAWHPLWLKWRGSLGETHLPDSPVPPAQTRLGKVFQSSRRSGSPRARETSPTPWPTRS